MRHWRTRIDRCGRPAFVERRRSALDRLRPPSGPRLWPLAAAALLVVALAAGGLVPRWGGLPQLVALPPLDHFADLRILLTRVSSVPVFVALLLAVVAVRVVLLALMLGGLNAARLGFAAAYYGTTSPLLLLVATVDFAAYAVLYSRLFWAAMAALVVLMLLAAPVPWRGGGLRAGLRQGLGGGLRLEVLLPYAAVLLGIGALADRGGPAVTVALVPVSAVATAVAVGFLARAPAPGALPRLAAAALVALLVGVGFVATRTADPAQPGPPRTGSLLLMSGINSSSGSGAIFETEVAALGYGCEQVYYYSYTGPGDGAPRGAATCPIRTGAPYQPADTLRPFGEQVDSFAEQVRDLPRPLVVAGHSLAAWVAWHAVAAGLAPEVDVLILVGPFPDSPVGYPPPGRDGTGRVAGDLMRLLAPLVELADFHFEPDAPAVRELLATPNVAAGIFARPLPETVRVLSLTSAADLPLMPGGWQLPVTRNACPVREAHPDLPETPAFYHEVNRFLAGEPALHCPPWRGWGAPVARPFGVPPGG